MTGKSLPLDDFPCGELNTAVVGRRIIYLHEVTSTNDAVFSAGGDGTVAVAELQTAGRGRYGRRWDSKPGLGLWFSVLFDGNLPRLPFAAALAVQSGLCPYVDARIKWPNDILVDGKKIAGMLVEVRKDQSILGIGVNVLHAVEDFPEELRRSAGSLRMTCPNPPARSHVLHSILTALDARILQLRRGHFDVVHSEWKAACNMIGKRVRYQGTEGIVREIDEYGALHIATHEGMRVAAYGDIVSLEDN